MPAPSSEPTKTENLQTRQLLKHCGRMSMSDLESLMNARSTLRETLTDFARYQGCPDPFSWAQGAVGILTGHLIELFPSRNGSPSHED